MSVRQLKDGRWIADVTVNYQRKTRICETEAEALRAEEQITLTLTRPAAQEVLRGVDESITFRNFVELVFWPMKTGLADNTKKGYERDIRLRLIPAFGDLTLSQINSYAIQSMVNTCSSRKVATNAVETLSAILGCAMGLQIISFNPANKGSSGIQYSFPPKGTHGKAPMYGDVISDTKSLYRLLSFMRDRFDGQIKERCVVLGACFGLRPEEVPALDWERVDISSGGIWVVQAQSSVGGSHLVETKNKKERFVPASSWALERLASWKRTPVAVPDLNGDASHPVVSTRNFTRSSLGNIQHHIASLKLKHSYEDGSPLPNFTQESLRHSFATTAIREGVPPKTLQAWLGHSDISTTLNRYVKVSREDASSDIGIMNLAMARVAAADGDMESGLHRKRASAEEMLPAVKALLYDFAVQVEAGRSTRSSDLSEEIDEVARALVKIASSMS